MKQDDRDATIRRIYAIIRDHNDNAEPITMSMLFFDCIDLVSYYWISTYHPYMALLAPASILKEIRDETGTVELVACSASDFRRCVKAVWEALQAMRGTHRTLDP